MAALREALDALAVRYPALALHGVVGDFTAHLDRLPRDDGGGPARPTGGWSRSSAARSGTSSPGSVRCSCAACGLRCGRASTCCSARGWSTDPEVLVAAYDDAAGVTAEFNRNVLHVLNRELHADLDVAAFAHVARWDAEREWIEMRLRAERSMAATVHDLGLVVEFAAGEEVRTEISAKFRTAGLAVELADAGLAPQRTWVDPLERFALVLAEAV